MEDGRLDPGLRRIVGTALSQGEMILCWRQVTTATTVALAANHQATVLRALWLGGKSTILYSICCIMSVQQ
jgi:hypothetical protein